MESIINGLVGIALVILFLGGYAVSVKSIPFAIIVVGVLALVGFDYFQAVKKEKNNHR